jgi:hypothetical protein
VHNAGAILMVQPYWLALHDRRDALPLVDRFFLHPIPHRRRDEPRTPRKRLAAHRLQGRMAVHLLGQLCAALQ